MERKWIILGAALALLLVVSTTSVANEVYFSQETVYIPECGNATVEILMNATNATDTWSKMIKFDSVCVNITEVNFTGSITPTNASWGHHDSYIYLGGTNRAQGWRGCKVLALGIYSLRCWVHGGIIMALYQRESLRG